MIFKDLFEVPQTNNRIDIIYTQNSRKEITNHTINWWESHGWQVVAWDNTGYKLAQGHNRILNDWRNSDRELLIMAHDDITLYTHRYLTAEWLKKPIVNGVYTLNSNFQMHHQALNSTGWDDGNHYWTPTYQICKLFAIGRKDVPDFDEEAPSSEDLEFAWACWYKGIPTHRLETVFLKERGMFTSSTYGNQDARRELYKASMEYIYKKYDVTCSSQFTKQYIKQKEQL